MMLQIHPLKSKAKTGGNHKRAYVS